MIVSRTGDMSRSQDHTALTMPNFRSAHVAMSEPAVAPAKKPAVAPPRPAVEPEREPNTVPRREPVPDPHVDPCERPDTTCPVRR
jgi:hypothetical protein